MRPAVTGSGEDDPVAEFIRSYRAQTAGQDALHRQVEEARTWTWAAVGAINRRDDARALTALGRLLREPGSTMVAVEVLTGILLIGVPPGALGSAARFPVDLPGGQHLPEAVRLASDLLTGVARSDGGLVTAGLRALAGDHGMAVLTVLARAAALRIELFVGLDGDTGDAYYGMARGSAIG